MNLAALLEGTGLLEPVPAGLASLEPAGLEYDSRRVGNGYLFFAFAGAKADGRQFAKQAMEKGALAVVSELPAPAGWTGPWLQVGHGRTALATASRAFYHHPDKRLGITGITGTNGKTTTCHLIDSILHTSGAVTSLVGTIEYHIAGERLPAVNTTPESLDLMRLFAETEQRGGSHVTMEVSSHALSLHRVFGIEFHTAVFTNLTRDHLDFHGTMDEYFAAKQTLFTGAGANAPPWAVINHDDAWGRKLATGAGNVLTYGIEGGDVRAESVQSGFDGLRFRVAHPGGAVSIESRMVGHINVYNILAACSAGFSYGLTSDTIARGILACKAVPGRFERVEEGQPFLVIVDYAHTDDALKNTIQVARGLKPRRVITLFGCGGDRDRAKRPLMGKAAAEASDFVVLTSDNPRSEDPLDIMNDALVGLRRFDTPHAVEPDREKAIRLAITEAQAGDILLICGKGHEPYQEIAGVKYPFDDREVSRSILRSFGYGVAA
jgi:UDP-N-acetylmuramoyl-L-alanyl-D-glutamate--2,6-diaminopimelate ligase